MLNMHNNFQLKKSLMYQKIFCLSTNLLCSKKDMENKISIIVEKWWETYVRCQLLICNHPFVRCGKINGDIWLMYRLQICEECILIFWYINNYCTITMDIETWHVLVRVFRNRILTFAMFKHAWKLWIVFFWCFNKSLMYPKNTW
jgi:hypothetical protein